MEKSVAIIINGTLTDYVDTVEQAERVLNPHNNRISVESPDGSRKYYYDTQSECDADLDGAYADQYALI